MRGQRRTETVGRNLPRDSLPTSCGAFVGIGASTAAHQRRRHLAVATPVVAVRVFAPSVQHQPLQVASVRPAWTMIRHVVLDDPRAETRLLPRRRNGSLPPHAKHRPY